MRFSLGPSAGERRLLPEGRVAGPMTWVVAIMMFLMVLSAAGGLALRHAAAGLSDDLADRVTVQIVEADPVARETQAKQAIAQLTALSGVRRVQRVGSDEMEALLEPWLGKVGLESDLPLPVLIDVDLGPALRERTGDVAALVRRAAPAARVDAHAQWLAPLGGLVGSLKWLALSLVLLVTAATAFTVVLAARAALNTHRATIDVMHLLGATDIQIARLFQRRIALDALFGGLVGFGAAALVILLLAGRISDVGSELLGTVRLPPGGWAALVGLPLIGALLATLAARLTVVSALRRML